MQAKNPTIILLTGLYHPPEACYPGNLTISAKRIKSYRSLF